MISFPIKNLISHQIERLILYLLMDLTGRVPFFHYVTYKNFIVTRSLPSGAITRPFCFSAQFKICCFFGTSAYLQHFFLISQVGYHCSFPKPTAKLINFYSQPLLVTTGKPAMLQAMGSQTTGRDLVTKQQQQQ